MPESYIVQFSVWAMTVVGRGPVGLEPLFLAADALVPDEAPVQELIIGGPSRESFQNVLPHGPGTPQMGGGGVGREGPKGGEGADGAAI